MLKIKVKEGENIDRALKRYKRKFRNTKVLDEIKSRKHYAKPSKLRREDLQKAEYLEKYELDQAD
ncbi:MAG: small subunit ribosomal protein S21 [Maribacter sp.]|jgi:small subunit ribosomal protein S21|tara:strand:+ start:107 stop:301 length:195 start_codon:yes stop_codon:yes gene_type:complete